MKVDGKDAELATCDHAKQSSLFFVYTQTHIQGHFQENDW